MVLIGFNSILKLVGFKVGFFSNCIFFSSRAKCLLFLHYQGFRVSWFYLLDIIAKAP